MKAPLTPFEQYIQELERLVKKTGTGTGNLVGRTLQTSLDLAKTFQKLETKK